MGWLEILKLALRFMIYEFPKLVEQYKELKRKKVFRDENERIEAAVLRYKNGKSIDDKLDSLKDLGK